MNWTLPRAEQATITIDVDPLEHGRTFRPTVALLGDVRETALDAARGERTGANPAWLARIAEVKAKWEAEKAGEAAADQVPIAPPRLMAAVATRLGDDDVVVSDASFAAGWIAGYLPARRPARRFLFARGQGALGYSVPGAIGAAAVAPPGARVVTLAGDGAFSYTLGELATQAQYGQRIVDIVINKGTMGWIRLWQEIYFKNTHSVDLETESVVPRYAPSVVEVCLAEGVQEMSLKGVYVAEPAGIGPALDEAFAHDGPSVAEVRIDDRATPIHSSKRRMREGEDEPRPRPGTVYRLREWTVSPELAP